MSMNSSRVLRWAVVYRAITTGSLLGGVALLAFGFVAGFWGSIELLLSDPLNPASAIEAANPAITVALAVAGIAVWQFGKTYALFYTLPRAAGREAADQFDRQALRSELMEGLSDQLADLEDDVAETRRSVQELKRAEHAASFDEREQLEGEASLEEGSSTSGVAGRRPLDRTSEPSRTTTSTLSSSSRSTDSSTDDGTAPSGTVQDGQTGERAASDRTDGTVDTGARFETAESDGAETGDHTEQASVIEGDSGEADESDGSSSRPGTDSDSDPLA